MSTEGLKLTLYFGESHRVGSSLLSDVVMERLGRAGVLACVLLRGVEGFGIRHRLRTDRLLTLSEDLSLMVIAVDLAAPIERLLDEILPLLRRGLVTLERIAVPDLQLDDDPGIGEGRYAKLMIYCGRQEQHRGRPLVRAVLDQLRDAGLPGASALVGLDGTILGERRRARFFSRNEGVPAVIVSVGPRERVLEMVPRLRAIAGRHVTTIERVHVMRRAGLALGDLPGAPARDRAGLALWQRVMVSCGEDARWGGHSLHGRLIRELRQAGAAGATVLRGTIGFSDDTRVHGDRLLSVRRRTPVLVTMIDTVPEVARLWPIIARASGSVGLVTCETIPAYQAHADEGLTVGGLELAETSLLEGAE